LGAQAPFSAENERPSGCFGVRVHVPRLRFVPRRLERVVPLRRTEIELVVERTISTDPTGPPRVARLGSRFAIPPDAEGPTDAELAQAYAGLLAQLDRALQLLPNARERSDRELSELVETYRPRQPELIDLLRSEGELTSHEYDLLKGYLSTQLSRGRAEAPVPTRPLIAALPLENDRTPATPRPVPELLSKYQITSLKQAGAVRARRQISYDEYMALKRHFTTAENPAATA
jgi:hypothetical protein